MSLIQQISKCNPLAEFQPNWERYVDRSLLVALFVLIGLGFVVMVSASVAVAQKTYGNPYFFLNRQIIFLFMGAVVALGIYNIRTVFWQNLGIKLLPIIILLLILVLIPGIGKEVKGSYRWFSFGGFSLQISELAKLSMIIYMSGYIVRHGKRLSQSDSWQPLVIPLVVLAVVDALLLLEPDFGSTVVITVTALALLFLGGVKLSRIGLLVIAVIVIAMPLVMMGYRGARILAYLDPWANASGKAYQTVHALMAVGDGGWFGAGLGGSVQKLFYLPEAHNDFVFAVLAEEFGFIGIVFTLLLFGWIVQRAFVIGFNADKAKLHFAAYIAYGIGFWIGFQSLFHIGVNLALLPPKGLTLPLISYGGSSVLVTMMAMAFLMRVHRDTQIALFGLSPRELEKQKKRKLAVRKPKMKKRSLAKKPAKKRSAVTRKKTGVKR
ncbi:MAG TPA: putative lipid II flippase FtsW [Leucothrix mucor]|nr:putative lipid II flippase FtsW [Leucothrix mucor]